MTRWVCAEDPFRNVMPISAQAELGEPMREEMVKRRLTAYMHSLCAPCAVAGRQGSKASGASSCGARVLAVRDEAARAAHSLMSRDQGGRGFAAPRSLVHYIGLAAGAALSLWALVGLLRRK